MRWAANWYPIAHVREVPTHRPSAHVVLGERLVVWRAGNTYHAAADACPHRAAPLSEGRIDDDAFLVCRYHGWRVAEDGQVDDPQQLRRPCGALDLRPVHECSRGLLWVWGDAHSPPVGTPPAEPPGRRRISDWTTIRVPAAFAPFVTNGMDAAHAHHTHHGIVGLRREDATPFATIRSGERKDNFTAWMATTRGNQRHLFRYDAPHRTRVAFGRAAGGLTFETFATPVGEGETLLASAAYVKGDDDGFALPLPSHVRAIAHRIGLRVALQDVTVMTNATSPRAPQPYDAAGVRFERFLARHGEPPFARDAPPPPALTPWHMHGCRCKVCRGFVEDLRVARGVWGAAALATSATPALSLSALGLAVAMHCLEQWMLEFGEDEHRG